MIQPFYLWRKIDESGMSGTGRVAEGVILPNDLAIMWWLVEPHSLQIYPSIKDLEHIHSHGKGTTEVVYETPRWITIEDVEEWSKAQTTKGGPHIECDDCTFDYKTKEYDTLEGKKWLCRVCAEAGGLLEDKEGLDDPKDVPPPLSDTTPDPLPDKKEG